MNRFLSAGDTVASAVSIALASFLLCNAAAAQDFERIAPKAVPRPGQTGAEPGRERAPALPSTAVRVKALKGIVFLTDPAAVRREGAGDVGGLDVSRVPALQTDEFRELMARYLGKPVSLASIDALERDVIAYYERNDRPFIVVTSPEQDITAGVLQLLVVEGKVGTVRVQGARVFDEKIYLNALGLKPGDPIFKRKLDEDVELLNRNPFRDVTVQVQPGQAFGTTDVVMRTRERDPFRLYAGYDNTGVRSTGDQRLSAGFNYGNVFGLDHQFNYQYTTTPDMHTYRAHSATYVAPLPWQHLLTVFGSYADIKGKDLPPPFDLKGHSHQIGLRYEIPLHRFDRVSHSLIAGLDYKRTNNNLEFGSTNVSATKADILQGVASYDLRAADAWGTTSMTASLFFSPGGLTGNNKDANFQALRAFAESQYTYANMQMRRITRLPHELTWHLSAQVQAADGNLLGSEQLGAGGYTSVRGYDELEATGDEGFIVRNELHTPAFVMNTPLPGKRSQLELLAFVDYGQVHNKRLLPGEARRVEMASTGVGVRFAVDQNVSLRFDYGWQLHDDGVPGGRKNSRPHFALLVSY